MAPPTRINDTLAHITQMMRKYGAVPTPKAVAMATGQQPSTAYSHYKVLVRDSILTKPDEVGVYVPDVNFWREVRGRGLDGVK